MLNDLVDFVSSVGGSFYVYCTDFTINLANLTGTSYYEVNFFFFCVLYPLLLLGLPITAVVLKAKHDKLKHQLSTAKTID